MAPSLSRVATLRGHSDRVWFAAFSPDGLTLATCGGDRLVILWRKNSAGEWAEAAKLEGGAFVCFLFWAKSADSAPVHERTVRVST